MVFLDFVKIHVAAGQGGSGCMSFRREKFIPKGGPDGGDGGRGGSIILEVNAQLHTLVDFKYHAKYIAKRGEHGKGSNRHGKSAKDIVLQVPCGTVVKDVETDEVLADLVEEKQRFIVARGGKGGRGNARFVTSTHRSPREWEVGESGVKRQIILELKLIADVGLVGKPNAGKSTLLANISAARPKIADYPFTTLKPNLGIIKYHDYKSFVMADIPGLIEGAHEGKGLGLQFLRHIERNRMIMYLVDPEDPEVEDPLESLHALESELKKYSSALADKPAIVVLTKSDIWQETDWLAELKNNIDYPLFAISSIAKQGLNELKLHLGATLEKLTDEPAD